MVDQRRQIIDEIHKLNILLIHTKLKTTRARTVARATTHVRNVDAARRGTVPRPKPSKPIEAVKDIKSGETSKDNVWSVNTDKSYHEEK